VHSDATDQVIGGFFRSAGFSLGIADEVSLVSLVSFALVES
jgi:hypothetical protein